MEVISILIGIGLAGYILIAPIIALVKSFAAERAARQNRETWQKLSQHVHALETQLQEIRERLQEQTSDLQQARADFLKAVMVREGLAPGTAAPPEPPKLPGEATGAEAPPSEPPRPKAPGAPAPTLAEYTAELLAASVVPPRVATGAARPAQGITAPPATPLPRPGVTGPPYVSKATAPAAAQPAPALEPPHFELLGRQKLSPQEKAKRVLSMEEVLGTDWLNKLGMIILVIGVALFLAYEMRELGPAGKVLVGFVVSAGLLGAGIYYERSERYRLLARVGIGGGWALAFFTTYAMYHVAPARILNSQLLDLVLLLGVAAVMVVHTLRYNSQVITGLALLLGFITVTISKSNVYSLTAGAILAMALVIIVQRRRWFELEVCGILASYFNHYYWLRPIIEPMHGHRHPFPEFMASAALLIFYWLVFRVSYLLRRVASRAEENVSTLAALLNTFLLLSLMKYQSVHPEWAFRFLLVLGAVEFVLGQLPITRRRRAAFVVLSVVGATLMVAAIPFKYSGETLPILWLAEAEALFLAGVFTEEIVFCRLGLLASMLVAFQLDRFALRQIYDTEWKGFHAGELIRGIMEFATATLTFYGNAHWLSRRYLRLAESRLERETLRVISYAGGLTALVGVWWLAPEAWVAVGFAALALALAVLATRTGVREFLYQAHALAFLAFLRVLAVNLGEQGIHHHIMVRLVTVTLTAVMLYASARWSGLTRTIATRYVSSGHTWTASFLVGLLAWYELQPVGVALAWGLLGLSLFEIGRARSLPQLRWQAYLMFGFSFLRLFYVNFNAVGLPGELSPRLYTTVPLALAFFYVYGVLDAPGDATFDLDRRRRAPEILCFLGAFTVAGLARFELDADWVVAAWSALVVVLLAIAWRYGRRIFLYQGLLLSAAVLMRGTLHNFYERSYFPAPPWQSRSLTVGVSVALLFAALPLAFQLKRPPEDQPAHHNPLVCALLALGRRPDQGLFFIPFFLLTILLALEMRKGMVTVAWGTEAVAIFLLALWAGQRSYRLSGLGLLLLCVGKIVVLDVWGLHPRDRYLTFIVLGVALLGVSFLYTRFRDAIRQYL